ncbi:armadillo-type protein [Mycena floridula]|nr:armadillo-type protein [Mycena floridula]
MHPLSSIENVSFSSSDALSRFHYTLVSKVEKKTPQATEQYISDVALPSIRQQLADPGLSLKKCRECLILLLYCKTAASSINLDFALSHAITVAEAGETISTKRIGYLFCAQIMPPNHELGLLLVNTVRKDLERSSVPHICLALDAIITQPTSNVIPAVQSRLHDLLSHNSTHVRRRALLAFRSLSQQDPDILRPIIDPVIRRMSDHDRNVAGSSLLVSSKLFAVEESCRPQMKTIANNILETTWLNHRQTPNSWYLSRLLRTLCTLGLSDQNAAMLPDIVIYAVKFSDHALLHQCFMLLQLSPGSGPRSLVSPIRDLLTSDVNGQYLFLSCLLQVDPVYWAGINPEIPAILEEWEVQRIMQLLDSPDPLLRTLTLRILNKIDPHILVSYYEQSIGNLPLDVSMADKAEYTCRLLEVLVVQSDGNGELFASGVQELLSVLDSEVLERPIEMVLQRNRQAKGAFQTQCATKFLSYPSNTKVQIGPTFMVIITALACEYCNKTPIKPSELLVGISSRLPTYPAAVVDASLLAMLRISAECEVVPETALTAVAQLSQVSKRHIRTRCDQFLTLSSQKGLLSTIVGSAQTLTLPGFLHALQRHQRSRSDSPVSLASPSPTQMNISLMASKLRYAAYEAPVPVKSLRGRRPSSTISESGRLSSDVISAAGNLALATATEEFELLSLNSPKAPDSTLVTLSPSRADLIAFDSPFIVDLGMTDGDFDNEWDALGSEVRGWCTESVEQVQERIQALGTEGLKVMAVDRRNLPSEIKLFLNSESGNAALKLKESEDASCLWRLRSDAAPLSARIQALFVT